MNSQKRKTILKSVVILLVLFAIVFALRAQSAGLDGIPNELKADYTDANGLPYFSEMDSYFNLRMTEDYMDHGYFGDTLVNGSGWDMHSYYPSGREVGNYQPMIAYITSALYGIINMFTSMSITEVAFWTGAFIASFAVIPTYLFTRRITNEYGAIAASLIVSLGPNYFAHTFAGFFDTDMFNVTLPLFFILFFIESVKSDNLVHKILFGLLSVISIGLFSLSWTGYMFYVAVMILVMVVFFILAHILNIDVIESTKKYASKAKWLLNQKELFSLILIIVLGFIAFVITVGPFNMMSSIGDLFSLITSLQSSAQNVWPNVLISVAEMQIPAVVSGGIGGAFLANSSAVVNGVGGIVALFGALFVLYSFVKRTLKLRNIPKDPSRKPPKGQRKSTSLKKEADMFSFKDVGSFGSNAEIANNKRTVLLYSSLFIVWIVACLVAVSQGTRFIQTLVIPIGLLAGVFVGYAGDYVKSNIDDKKMLFAIAFFASALVAFPITQLINVKLPNPMFLGIAIFAILLAISLVVIYGFSSLKDADISIKKTLVVVLITIALISPTVCGAYQVAENTVPGSSDPMWNAMDFIKENTTSDSVIVSWWDFGYLFQIASDHSTSFDGGSQTGDRAFWVGRLLSTSDLNLAKGILQMLTTTGDNATNLLCDYTGSNATAVDALIKVLPMNKDKAKSTLVKDYNLTSTQATNVIKQSHPAHPNKVELVLSSDMIQKAGWWSYFGSWDFDKLNSTNYQYYVAQDTATISPNSEGKLPILEDNGIRFNAVIDRGAKNTTHAHTEAVFANNGSEVDINGTKYNPLNASNVMIVEDNYLVENTTLNNDGEYTLFVIGQQGSYSAILMDNHIKDSLFTKLYILGGAGQDTFKLEDMENGVAVWTINS